jgi:hypothetical protein
MYFFFSWLYISEGGILQYNKPVGYVGIRVKTRKIVTVFEEKPLCS